jgi:hypothetical protein
LVVEAVRLEHDAAARLLELSAVGVGVAGIHVKVLVGAELQVGKDGGRGGRAS